MARLAGRAQSFDSLDSLDVDYTSKNDRGSFKFDGTVDSNEFDLPEIDEDNLPSLEDILKEPDDAFSVDSLLLSPVSTFAGLPNLAKHKGLIANGSVLRHVILKKISGQLVDACARRDAGLPTAMAVSMLIAIGTSHGLVLVFEPRDQALKLILGNTSDGANYGAVTALGINRECSRLLCGYAKGQITMWDLSNGNCLRVITDAHPPGYAVLHLQFTDDSTIAMCSDSSGSVYSLSFRRLITRSCESTCFFSGSKGEVCIMAPLHLHIGMRDSQLHDSSILAMASLTKVIVVNLKPFPKAIFTKKLPGGRNTLPLLGWQFAVIQKEENSKYLCPVLAFARDKVIHFYQIWKYGEEFKFVPFQTIETEYSLVSLHWMNPKIIVIIDSLERIRTIDVKTKEELECLDLSIVQLVYGSSYFKSLATGGNVSKALNAASEYACYHSVQVFNGQLLLLGTKSIHCLTIRSWRDRIDYFVKQNLFLEALQLALSFYEERAKAVVNLAGSRQKRKIFIAQEIAEVLQSYVEISFTVNCPKTHKEEMLAEYFSSLVPTCVEYCVATGNLDLLFGEIYDRFSEEPISKKVFLEGLEPYILDDRIATLTPVVMQDFVKHFEATRQLRKLEACLVHLDVTAVDLHHMVKMCWTHSLYDLAIYVYNKGMNDFLSPMEEMLNILRSLLKSKRELTYEESAVGYKLLVYISCCLTGRQYPRGLIDEDKVSRVKCEVYEFLVAKRSKDIGLDDQSYPSLHVLLEFDTREFLNVMSIAFEEPEFEVDHSSFGQVSKRQKVVDILLQLMVTNTLFTPTQVGWLFTFIARQMAKFEGSIRVNKLLFEQVLEYLTNPDDDSRHEERQQALLELLSAGGLHQFDDSRIIKLAEAAKFFQVCELLYEKNHQYAQVLSCYLRDPARKHQSFSYIVEMMSADSFTDLERGVMQNAVLAALDQLVEIDSQKMALLIIEYFSDCLSHVVGKLEYNSEAQYEFLKGVFMKRESSKQRPRGDLFNPDASTHEQFIQLMCRYDPQNVYPYLRETDNYRLEQTLAIVRKMKVVDATAYLLERTGDVKGAFNLLLDNLKDKVQDFSESFAVDDDPLSSKEGREKRRSLKNALMLVIHVCQRNSSRLDAEEREALWFPLLETIMAPQRRVKDVTSIHFVAFKELTKQVLSSMMGHIALPAVLKKIMQDSAYNSGKFGEIKELILGMLDTYNYELTLLQTTKSLLGKDLHHQYCTQKNFLSRGYSHEYLTCNVCYETFGKRTTPDSVSDVIVFRCNHAFHKQCLEGSVGYGNDMKCILCNKTTSIGSVYSGSSAESSSSAGKTDENPTKPKHKKGEKKTLFTPQQELALQNLAKHNNESPRLRVLSDLRPTDDMWVNSQRLIFARPGSVIGASEDITLGGKEFKLRLAPGRM
ncbi:vacuolar protein sorting-associated protein 8 homolog isoform X2 [Rhopilema esculentum]|uniref:vacuolar protein sorting-associated protein 8 homolog isoform X2 n=1 Tax=Rhopilema esculentum TaxID=499914 RepID=UPI0031CDBF30